MTDAKTEIILKWFEEISKIPRCSKNEQAICDWLENWGKSRGFTVRKDKVQNLVIEVPAAEGYESAAPLVIQGHMDMVCEKTKDSDHDFTKDPIRFIYEDGWLTADKTTLGADNGIALAMALTAADEKDVAHPPLELLFTVDEETGLTGAMALEPGFIKGKTLINLDAESEGVLTVGCAGGKDTELRNAYEIHAAPADYKSVQIIAQGMRGGHSGVDIHQKRANAIHILGRALNEITKITDVRMAGFSGGTAHNAIPRDAEALVCLPESDAGKVESVLTQLDNDLKAEYAKTDPKICLRMNDTDEDAAAKAMGKPCTRRILDLILAIPHGVSDMSADVDGLVETSSNFALIQVENGDVKIQTSQRSPVMNRLDWLTNRVESVGRLAGGTAESGNGYPAWQPNLDSELLKRCKTVYKELFGKEPVIEVIHAGLECGIIGSKYTGMEMISFGPDMKDAHSPDEKIEVASIGKVWTFLEGLIKSYH
ncbi:MAG: aminoacyl-histidine dipeptidase [Deltaproteobacteria bacterium]|nr:aminoacyl-histidine dipeptidase [Deltaproteobacteria bacterium]